MEDYILIVDDIETNRILLKNILSKTMPNLIFYEASTGVEALQLIREEKMSVVILDIMMPDMDGIEVLQELEASEVTSRIPIIMYTSVDEINTVEKALDLGALDYFTKPLTKEQIKITLPLKIKNALKFHKQNKKLLEFQHHIEDELKLAEKLQRAIVEESGNYDLCQMWGRYIPCESIGGDIFSCQEHDGKVWFIIADVTGHGIAAAMVSTMLKTLFYSSIQLRETPDQVLQTLNSLIVQTISSYSTMLISAFVGCIDEGSLSYSNAGHHYPIKYSAETNTVEELMMNGLLLGIFEHDDYQTATVPFHSGDTITLFTDGLFSMSPHTKNELRQVQLFLSENAISFYHDIPDLLTKLEQHFYNRTETGFEDDVAIMTIKRK